MKPKIIRIRSRDVYFQHIQVLLRNREKRTRYREFVVEGVRSINAALQFNWEIRSLIYAAGQPLSNWAKEVLSGSNAEFHFELNRELMSEISSKEETSELIAVVSQRDDGITALNDSLESLGSKENLLMVLFDRPGSPGNLGSSIRSCDALGVAGIILTGHAVDLYDPLVIRAATGSFFAVPAFRIPAPKDVLSFRDKLREAGLALQLVATDEVGQGALDQADLTGPTLLMMGNETSGLCKAYREAADRILYIPMGGSASSLNISCATSIFLYECQRQRLQGRLS